jgi:hypothetical protein
MRSEDSIRDALQRAAATHSVNEALSRSTIVKARLARLGVVAGAAAIATALVFAGAGTVDALRPSGASHTPGSSPGEDSQDSTREAPLLLVTAEGWRVIRAHQQFALVGELTFSDGERELALTWRPADTHEEYVDDRRADGNTSWDITMAGRDGILFQYDGTTDFTALWLDGRRSLELRGVFDTVEEYLAVAETLRRVDAATWYAALPDDTILPDERATVVEEMLSDVPVPPGVDVPALKSSRTAWNRYQLGAEVTGAVACEWVARWVDAIEAGDEQRAREAEEAMSSARDWAILVEMDEEGDWPEVLWEYADAMAGDGTVTGGRKLTIDESYKNALGCHPPG